MNKLLALALLVTLPLIPLSLMMENYKLDKVSDTPPPQLVSCETNTTILTVTDEPEEQRRSRFQQPTPRRGRARL
jgi:hypothetical protein